MPSFEFHPAAHQAIDQGGTALLAQVTEHDLKPSNPPAFPSERPIAAHITDKDMLEEPILFETNIFGNTVARYFPRNGRIYGLGQDAFQNLRRLADQVVKAPWVNEAVGRAFIEDNIFLWCRENFQSDSPSGLADYLIKRAVQSVRRSSVWIPIAFMEVEQEFQFGLAKLAPISVSMLDARERGFIENSPDHADKIRALFASKRQKYQGLAAVVLDVDAAKDHGMARGLEIAEIVVGLLRLYSPAAHIPWLICPCAIIGTEYVPSTTAISYGVEGSFGMTQGTKKPLPYPWQISASNWSSMRNSNLDALADLIDGTRLSDFQTRLRTSILAYSKGLTLREVSDRLVYSLSALEGLLLRDPSEPIQQNLGERLAFLLHRNPAARQEIVQNIRDIYGMRSRYIHHQISVSEEGALEKFFPTARAAFFAAMGSVGQFSTGRDFIDAIDRVKFGG